MRVKICGITREEDAALALALGADAIGVVFYPNSARSVTVEQAQAIRGALSGLGMMVGLFVDPSVEEVEAVLEAVPLNLLQFHGKESPVFCGQFGRPYLKAIPMSADVNLAREAERFHAASALLLDSSHEGQFGGTGNSFDWDWVDRALADRVILAGGLHPDNVAAAVRQVKPAAVDVSSGVERAKGIKDPASMRAFIEAAKLAASELQR